MLYLATTTEGEPVPRVIWIEGRCVVAGTRFANLDRAEAHARSHFFVKQGEGIDRVEVRDDNGRLHFTMPKSQRDF